MLAPSLLARAPSSVVGAAGVGLASLAECPGATPPLVDRVLAVVVGLLLLATLVTAGLGLARPERDHRELRQRIGSWWVMVAIFYGVMSLPPCQAVAAFGLLSYLAFKEFVSLIPTRRADRRVLLWAYLAIPFQYYWVTIGWYGMFVVFVPLYMFFLVPLRAILVGETQGFLRSMATLHWGLMTTVFSLSHTALLLRLHQDGAPVGPGLVLFLVVLTQLNDVFQFLWGKSLGGPKIVPTVSPGKTWAGFLGGAATTTLLALALGPALTPLTRGQSMVAGLILGVGGFVGDVTVSAIKRDLGVKDSGALIPGHGGILDRLDSLTVTAPLFFHFVWYSVALSFP